MKTDPKHPSLSYCFKVMPDTEPNGRSYQPVAENIEDLQIRYILEDGTETDDFDGEDNNVDNFSKVKLVRISMVARSDRLFPYYKGHRPGLEDNPGGEEEDHYMRRVYTAEIETRNINIIK